ncbi:MAG: hypothetical protein JRN67_08095 [Nitrososphaerota archaeon]|nr:hypothetical protein [Nitrososphaerota archaeon]
MAKPTLTQLIETGVFGIAGVAEELKESLPKLVEKGRSSLEPKLGMAKFVGQFAVARLESEFQKRTDSTVDQITDFVALLFGQSKDNGETQSYEDKTDTSAEEERLTPGKARSNGLGGVKGIDADNLPIVGYGTLSAQQIIARLDSLNASELDQVEQYELNHRNRASILKSVASKRGSN